MTALRYVLSSLIHYWRIHLAVVAGVAIATAVITGALLVGDSVRGSLQRLALERLGRIDQVILAEQPFQTTLVDELTSNEAAPLLLVPGTLASVSSNSAARATQLSVIGHTPPFWQLGSGASPPRLNTDQIAISRSIADELNVSEGSEVLLRVPRPSNLPADSVLGEKDDTTTSSRFEVAAILPDEGLARFSLRPSQQTPRNVFVALEALQAILNLQGRVNAATVVGEASSLQPTLEDYNIAVSEVDQTESGKSYLRISADRLVLPPAMADATAQALSPLVVQPAITYLANTLKRGARQIPYSTITGIDSTADLGPLLEDQAQPIVLADDEIALNAWAAKDLNAKVGDEITVSYYQPETTHGILSEAEPVSLKLRAIVALEGPDGQPTIANDPKLTPDLPGVTDQRSIGDWDLPFELVEEIRKEDEDYWDEYSTTPKAFVSYQLAKRLWSTRWGTDSILRIPTNQGTTAEQVQELVRPDPAKMGMIVLPVKDQGLAASRGTTPFEALFLGFSFFLVASAIMLIALLFRLGVENRARELGILQSTGWSLRRLRKVWLTEALIVTIAGTLLGMFLGIGYARLMIYGLSTWWIAATVTPFLELHLTTTSLVLGCIVGVVVTMVTLSWSLRKLTKVPVRKLLANDCGESLAWSAKSGKTWIAPLLLVIAAAVGFTAIYFEGEAQAGAFFGSGSLVLAALLIWLSQRLKLPGFSRPRLLTLAGLSMRNARRNPARTILSTGLAAVASFLIVALSAFRLAPTEQGTGGFQWIATSDQALHFDLNTRAGRDQLGFGEQDSSKLNNTDIYSFRTQAGEDASCLNLYRTSQPEVIGVPRSFHQEQQFGWSANMQENVLDASPWDVLDKECGTDEAKRQIIPVVLDKNTATYSLHLSGVGAQLTIEDTYGQPVTLEVVGLLASSIFQGKLLISEANFLRLFPETSGQQLFLIRQQSTELSTTTLATLLETQLEDYGFDVIAAQDQLAGFLAVQNTYLSTFQSLGALGLLLGTFGLAVAQLRSVLERRGEFALMRSAGFRRARLARMVLGENIVLLLGGLAMGTLAALVAVLPHYFLQSAGTPWLTLLGLLTTVGGVGIIAGWLAVRAAANAPLLPAIRGD